MNVLYFNLDFNSTMSLSDWFMLHDADDIYKACMLFNNGIEVLA